MNHWPYIVAAYVIALGGAGGLTLWSLLTMRRAEARAEAVTRRK